MAFDDMMGPDCTCCAAPTTCPPTFKVQDCAGAPIAGATVAMSIGGGPVLVSGTTGADGTWSAPNPPGVPTNSRAVISYDGTSITLFGPYNNTTANCTAQPVRVCFDKSVVVINTVPGSTIVKRGASGPTLDFPPSGVTVVQSPSGTFTYTHKRMRLCAAATNLPITLDWEAKPATSTGYKSVCGPTTMACNGNVSVDGTFYYWPDHYFDVSQGACATDGGCSFGAGPAFRGLVAKEMEVRFTSLDGSNYFASDEGVWIPVHGALNGTPNFGVTWQSDCRDGRGNYYTSGPSGCLLNKNPAGQTSQVFYQTTRAVMSCSNSSGTSAISYFRFGTDDCTKTRPAGCGATVNACSCTAGTAGTPCDYCETFNSNIALNPTFNAGYAQLASPCNFTYIQRNNTNTVSLWKVDVREA